METVDNRVFIGIRTTAEIAEKLRKLAAEDERSVSNYVHRLLRDHVDAA